MLSGRDGGGANPPGGGGAGRGGGGVRLVGVLMDGAFRPGSKRRDTPLSCGVFRALEFPDIASLVSGDRSSLR